MIRPWLDDTLNIVKITRIGPCCSIYWCHLPTPHSPPPSSERRKSFTQKKSSFTSIDYLQFDSSASFDLYLEENWWAEDARPPCRSVQNPGRLPQPSRGGSACSRCRARYRRAGEMSACQGLKLSLEGKLG